MASTYNNNNNSLSSSRISSGCAIAALNDEIEKSIECPVCTEVLFPPIYTCQIGHIICNDCKIKLKDCVLCKYPYTNTRNFSLESIVQAAKFYCEHRQNGCEVVATMEELKKHHIVCQSRPLKCHLNDYHDCKGDLLYMSEYVEHLNKVHKPRPLKCSKSMGANVFTQKFEINDWGEDTYSEIDRRWAVSLFNFDGKVFISRIYTLGPTFYFRFYLIDEQKEASKYAVKITIQKSSNCHIPKYELTTLVPSIREISETKETLPYVALHGDMIKSLGIVIPANSEDPESKSKLRWVGQYKIMNVSS